MICSSKLLNVDIPRVVIASPQGHSGKSIISIGICSALKQRKLIVQPFKRGPDYIDPSWLASASERRCYNLDTIMMHESAVLKSFYQAARDANIAVIEGAMGLFDGFDSAGRGSTAYLSRLIKSPVVLVVNAARMTRSAAAMVSGFQHFEKETVIAGVIFNSVSGSRHAQKLKAAIETYCGIPVLGLIPKDSDLSIAERHLGLTPYAESGDCKTMKKIRDIVERNLDLDQILKIAGCAVKVNIPPSAVIKNQATSVKIGVLFDRVFNFYYSANLEALKHSGAELVFIDSLKDRELPDLDALYIGGGFPELFLPQLESNFSLRRSIACAIEDYLPVYAECAGLAYLCRDITWQNHLHEMVGIIPASVELSQKPEAHGYAYVEVTGDNPFFQRGLKIWGHEFHHSRITNTEDFQFAYSMLYGHGINNQADGIVYKNLLASYLHIHALGAPGWANNFVALALKRKLKNAVPLKQ